MKICKELTTKEHLERIDGIVNNVFSGAKEIKEENPNAFPKKENKMTYKMLGVAKVSARRYKASSILPYYRMVMVNKSLGYKAAFSRYFNKCKIVIKTTKHIDHEMLMTLLNGDTDEALLALDLDVGNLIMFTACEKLTKALSKALASESLESDLDSEPE